LNYCPSWPLPSSGPGDSCSIRAAICAMMQSRLCMPVHTPGKEREDGLCRARGSGDRSPAAAGPGDLSHPAAAIPVGCGRPGRSPRRAALCPPGGAPRRRTGPRMDGRGAPHTPSPRSTRGVGSPGPTDVHSRLSRGADPDLPQRPGRRTQAGHGPVCRHQGFHRVDPRPRSGSGAAAFRSRPARHDGSSTSLRGHGEPGPG
jgi:hypothetical protein